MKKGSVFFIALLLTATACAGAGQQPATILVDYSHDEFNSSFIKYFPQAVTVGQGAELLFKQTWTGEPHTVTGGTLVDDLMDLVGPYIEKKDRGEPIPNEPPKDVAKAEEKVVWAYGDQDDLNQTGAQPCYIAKGAVPKDGKPCKVQDQPEFTGAQSFYNSGIIPYQGAQGNTYRVKLADNIKPGSYWFYCIVHGEFQSTKVTVKPKGAKVSSAAEINRNAQAAIDGLAKPLLSIFRGATRDGKVTLKDPGSGNTFTVSGNFAGLYEPKNFFPEITINEFIPRRIRVKAGEPITWNFFAAHTVSFGVPEYFPVIEFKPNGTVVRNTKLGPAAGGARRFKESERQGGGGAPEPVAFDGGTYDGSGFWSSGLIGAEPWLRYTMRITKPGTYRYACLVHPPMVGTVVVA